MKSLKRFVKNISEDEELDEETAELQKQNSLKDSYIFPIRDYRIISIPTTTKLGYIHDPPEMETAAL